ncbi:MAG TPA: heme o synthase [Micromonosporaceae bacterium]|jgi:protoheme IX farnesyltransferase|nr:heme o synthase [Micromonosporaceae bacterium]
MSALTGHERPTVEAARSTPTGLAEYPRERSSLLAVIRAYVALTKPRIVELLLVTAVPTTFLATGGLPRLLDVLVVIVAGALSAGSANALNCYIDRDIDQVMRRTARRPLPQHVVAPRQALRFGLLFGGLSVVVMAFVANALAAVLTAGAIFYYVVVYTLLLKRHTVHNTVLGGICGAMPVLIAWAVVTGSLDWPAWVLFGVVFFWQPTHFWALALKFRDDYAAAGIPMLPVVASPTRVAVESLGYAGLTVVSSLLLWPVAAGLIYLVTAVVVGALLLVETGRLLGRVRHGQDPRPMRLFHWTNTYLTLLFLAIAVDVIVG